MRNLNLLKYRLQGHVFLNAFLYFIISFLLLKQGVIVPFLLFYITIVLLGRIPFDYRDISVYLLAPTFFLFNKSFIEKHSDYLSKIDHHAIIIAHKFSALAPAFYIDGIDILMEYLHEKELPCKIYRCTNFTEFESVLKNKKSKNLWIFGHGSRHALLFGRKNRLYYCDVKKFSSKALIAQLHCNHGGGKSLADYIKPKESYANHSKRTAFDNRDTITEILKHRPKSNLNK